MHQGPAHDWHALSALLEAIVHSQRHGFGEWMQPAHNLLFTNIHNRLTGKFPLHESFCNNNCRAWKNCLNSMHRDETVSEDAGRLLTGIS